MRSRTNVLSLDDVVMAYPSDSVAPILVKVRRFLADSIQVEGVLGVQYFIPWSAVCN